MGSSLPRPPPCSAGISPTSWPFAQERRLANSRRKACDSGATGRVDFGSFHKTFHCAKINPDSGGRRRGRFCFRRRSPSSKWLIAVALACVNILGRLRHPANALDVPEAGAQGRLRRRRRSPGRSSPIRPGAADLLATDGKKGPLRAFLCEAGHLSPAAQFSTKGTKRYASIPIGQER